MNERLLQDCLEELSNGGFPLTGGGENAILDGMKTDIDKTDNERLGERAEQIVLAETTRRQKAEKTIRGLSPRIKTFCILTGENPMGRRQTTKANEVLNGEFLKDLGQMHFRYYPVRGSYAGNPEHSFLIFNIGLDDAKYLGHKYDQEAFLFAEVLAPTQVVFKYYEKKFTEAQIFERGWRRPLPPTADYRLIDTSNRITVCGPTVEDNFTTVFRDFKYKVPFKCFEEFEELLADRCALFEDYRELLNDKIQYGIDGNGARNRMQNRASIYGDHFQMFWDSPVKA